mgnify:CR=1 FL=1
MTRKQAREETFILIFEKEFNEIGVDVVYLEHTDGISSTIIREKIK